MNGGTQVALYVVAGSFLVALMLSIYRRREAVAQKLRSAFFGFGALALTAFIVKQYTNDSVKVILSALFAELLVLIYTRPRSRSRYISAIEKRKVIERFERRTGQRYSSKKHEIDHIVPYSRGGDSRAHNLRVIDRDRNRAKSAKSPWWDVFGT